MSPGHAPTRVAVPGPLAIAVVIPKDLLPKLEVLAASERKAHRAVVRARIVLFAAAGLTNPAIAAKVGCSERNVYRWRTRFAQDPSLKSLGGPAPLWPACDDPCRGSLRAHQARLREAGRAGRRGQGEGAAARHLDARGVEGCTRSRDRRLDQLAEIRRILKTEDLKPHRIRYWLHSQDPEFRPKVLRICKLYLAPPPGARVVCVDEKTCIQALERKHLGRPAAPGRAGRREFEYTRHGTRTLIAAFDIRTGDVFGQLRAAPPRIDAFMTALARPYPRGEVYVVWDNLNIHHGEAWVRFNARQGGRFHFVHTPLHASWVKILHRRILKHGHFPTAESMVERIQAFIRLWNKVEGHPFRWTFRGRFQDHHSRQAA